MSERPRKVLASKRKWLQQAKTTVTFLDPIVMRDNNQEAKYNSLLTRKLISSRFVCQNTLKTLGLLDDVYELLSQIDLWLFATRTDKTYTQPILEFLSSLMVDMKEKKMTYRLCSQEFETSVEELNRFFLPQGGEEKAPHEEKFRMLLTGKKGATSTKNLQHPAIRYVQRENAGSILGRGGTASTASDSDFLFLQCMLAYPEPRQPSLGWFMMKNLHQVANNKKPRGIISIGALVTMLAEGHGMSLKGLAALDDKPFLTSKSLHSFQLIMIKEPSSVKEKIVIYHPGHDGVRTPMPLGAPKIDLAIPTTWKLSSEDENDDEEGQPSISNTMQDMWGDIWVVRENQEELKGQVQELHHNLQGVRADQALIRKGLERVEANNNEMREEMKSIVHLLNKLSQHLQLPPH